MAQRQAGEVLSDWVIGANNSYAYHKAYKRTRMQAIAVNRRQVHTDANNCCQPQCDGADGEQQDYTKDCQNMRDQNSDALQTP